ncbi:hypothetical protein IW140_000265 [Coemansia sp. RSA 1813]|nr:hypothetical protein EV178_000468 [Coemansia sp. RSA 1646]KAJ1773763.1 hypothetical protein LPJ74_000306 [Coemansia sp. RSA 1843]KAJ2093725.1 hypothetical protein IW138_000120 [Coemansia sp. RSA 986]KAJ2217937.1 hypothetical protein EV179_000081 [Coemansia sp. RSA 487]KAJ2573221.1 hypothetical protein IW140_000265 [Coemansia sp. RSA 1813]
MQDMKKYLQNVTGITWHEITVWDRQTGIVYDDMYELPHTPQSAFEVNVLRVYFSFRHSRKSSGAYMAYVCTSSLVNAECVGHGLPVSDRMVMYGWCFVSLLFDTFESLGVVNGDTFYIEDRRISGLSAATEKQLVSNP